MGAPTVVRRPRPEPKTGRSARERGPEAVFVARLLGKQVLVRFVDAKRNDVQGTLKWVDRYTLGVTDEDGDERMVYKHAVQEICEI